MTLIQQLIVLIIMYLCAYTLIDRLCKCILWHGWLHIKRRHIYGSSRKETRSKE